MKKLITILLLLPFICSAQLGNYAGVYFIGSNATPVFSPKDSSGLLLWVKADALSLSDNDPVSTWPDSSGNTNNLTQSGGQRPVFKTNQQNSLPGLLFTSTSSQYFNLTTPIASALPYTLFVVYKKTSSGGLGLMLNGVAGNQYIWTDYSDGNLYIYPSNFSYNTGTAGYTTFTTVSSIISASGVASVQINGGSHSMTIGGGAGDTGDWFYLGANSTYGYADMTILELILYNHAASATLRANTENYLRVKYATW